MQDLSGFWHSLERHGQNVALVVPGDGTTGDTEVTYGELAAKADAYADQFRTFDPTPNGDSKRLIAIAMQPRLETLAAYFGALRGGHAVLLMDDSLRDPDNKILARFPFDILVYEEPEGSVSLLSGRSHNDGAAGLRAHPDLSVLLSTSGSTGEAKLVRLSETAVQSNAAAIADYLSIQPDSRAILTLPLFYSYGMSVLHSYLAAGASLILNDIPVTEPQFWQDAERLGASSMALVPHQCQTIERSEFQDYPISSLSYVTQAGGRLEEGLIQTLAERGRSRGWRFFVMYGQTEAAPRISYVPPEMLPEAAHTIGRAIPGGELDIRDEAGQAIRAPGVSGELVYKGPNVMMGYAETPEDLTRGQDLSELSTGDLAQWDDHGLVRIVGRLKRFVKLYGMRISLDEVETLLEQQGIEAYAAGTDQTLVLLMPDMAQADRARDLVAARLKVPAHDIEASLLEALPLLPSGKRDQRRLNEMALEIAKGRESGRGRRSRTLTEVFAEATRSRNVQPGDSFASLGGDSLGFLQVSLDLEERFGHVPDGWEHLTLAELAALAPADKPRSTIGTDVIVRVLAISLIVLNHTFGGGLNGGTWVLLMATGLSFFRFQIPSLGQVKPWVMATKLLYPLLPLYFLSLFALMAAGKSPPVPLLTLTANLGPDSQAFFYNVNWFISLYVQLVLFLLLIFSFRPLRQAALNAPMQVVASLFALSLAVSLGWQFWVQQEIGAFSEQSAGRFWVRSLFTCFPMAALGLLIGAARHKDAAGHSVSRIKTGGALWLLLLCVALNAVIFPVNSDFHFAALVAGGALLALDWKLTVPKLMGRLLRHMASSALFVYLLHPFVLHAMKVELLLHERLNVWVMACLALCVSFVVAWVALEGFRALERVLAQAWGRSRAASRAK